jgi:hypothetical protein
MEGKFCDFTSAARQSRVKGALDGVVKTILPGHLWPTRRVTDEVCAAIGVGLDDKQDKQKVAALVCRLAPGHFQAKRDLSVTKKTQRGVSYHPWVWEGPSDIPARPGAVVPPATSIVRPAEPKRWHAFGKTMIVPEGRDVCVKCNMLFLSPSLVADVCPECRGID